MSQCLNGHCFRVWAQIGVGSRWSKFMLPIRVGMVNAAGPQELFVYTLTRRGRVEATNFLTVKLPTGMDLPVMHIAATMWW